MLANPKELYFISEEKGTLRVRCSKQAVLYSLAVATGIELVNLLTLGLYILIAGPLGKHQWVAVIILGVMGLAAYVVFLFLILRQHAYVFDRVMDRFFHGNKLVSLISNIRHLQIHREQNARTSKAFYVLSVILAQGEPHLMYRLEEPATELFALSEMIAEYLGKKVDRDEDLVLVLKGLGTRFGRWYAFGLLLFFANASLATLGWWWVLWRLGNWRAMQFPNAVYALTPIAAAWLIPALFLGLICGYAIMSAIYRRILKDEYQEYVRYQELKDGYKTSAALVRSTYLTVTLGSIAAILLFLDWYVVFFQEEIVINRPFSVSEERHRYSDVIEIKTAPWLVMRNGKKVHRRAYLIRFSDDTYWSTDQDPSGLDDRGKKEVLKFVSSKSQIPIREVEVLSLDEVF